MKRVFFDGVYFSLYVGLQTRIHIEVRFVAFERFKVVKKDKEITSLLF